MIGLWASIALGQAPPPFMLGMEPKVVRRLKGATDDAAIKNLIDPSAGVELTWHDGQARKTSRVQRGAADAGAVRRIRALIEELGNGLFECDQPAMTCRLYYEQGQATELRLVEREGTLYLTGVSWPQR